MEKSKLTEIKYLPDILHIGAELGLKPRSVSVSNSRATDLSFFYNYFHIHFKILLVTFK